MLQAHTAMLRPLFLRPCALLAISAVAALLLPACSPFSPASPALTTTSLDGAALFRPALPTAVFRSTDRNTADIYLTDLPADRLAAARTTDDLRDLAGVIVHVRLFLVPSAGRTPIDATACNAAVRQTVLAKGPVGIYGGGGYLSVGDDPRGETFSGTIRDASLRLLRASPDFADRLGPSTLVGTVAARRDDARADLLAAIVERFAAETPATK
jgi:hypothetical protein